MPLTNYDLAEMFAADKAVLHAAGYTLLEDDGWTEVWEDVDQSEFTVDAETRRVLDFA